MSAQTKGEKLFRGIAVSAGICRGKILVLDRAQHVILKRKLADAETTVEIGRFEKALVQTRQQISEVQRKLIENMGTKEGDIFEAHLLMLEDRMLVDEVIRTIKEQKVNADPPFIRFPNAMPPRWRAWMTNISVNVPATCAT